MKRNIALTAVLLLATLTLAAQSVTLVSPNGGESWQLGKSQTITWMSTNAGSATVNITLRNGGGKVGDIKAGVALAAGSWTWTSIGTLANGQVVPVGSDYIVRINIVGFNTHDDSNGAFAITTGTTPVIIKVPPYDRVPPVFQKPKLAVSDIDLTPNADGFGIIFSYKNAGNGPLPKASEVPVKPTYRVLIDGRETASGSLFIPAFAAPSGWEQAGYFGGQIVLPTIDYVRYHPNWYIGNLITVHINENKVMGMDSHSLTLNLKPIALKYRFDLVRNGITLDWNTGILTVSLRLDGNVPAGRELWVYCGSAPSFDNFFLVKKPATPGTYVITKKLSIFTVSSTQLSFYMNSYVTVPDGKQVWDMDYRNHDTIYLKFTRPNPNPVQ